ncbi:MAG: MFS transporter [Phycisphaerae bacterium]|nr:MFS transporter [Phycisphaerae bacterium]
MRQFFKDKNFLLLCLAAFFMSSCLQLGGIVLPFAVKAMRGSDTDIGLCFLGQMSAYVICCMLAFAVIDRFKPKRVLLITAGAGIIISFGFFVIVWYGNNNGIFFNPITRLIILMVMVGVITAFFWPVIMGWISTGYEGAELTKRFGFYNVAWASANTIMPVIGGYLMEINYSFPLAVSVVIASLCFISLYPTKCISQSPKPHQSGSDTVRQQTAKQNRQFVWMSRVALFATWVYVGIFRSQLGILYKFELNLSESVYGWATALMCLSNVIVFLMMGRSHWWHYKKTLFALIQASAVLSLIIILFSGNAAFQLFAAGLSGVCYGFIYGSHQYYGVSGGTKRSGLMAIHETIIGAGFAIGALVGGILSDSFGRYSPYWFACAVIVTGGFIQVLLWKSLQKSEPRPLESGI